MEIWFSLFLALCIRYVLYSCDPINRYPAENRACPSAGFNRVIGISSSPSSIQRRSRCGDGSPLLLDGSAGLVPPHLSHLVHLAACISTHEIFLFQSTKFQENRWRVAFARTNFGSERERAFRGRIRKCGACPGRRSS